VVIGTEERIKSTGAGLAKFGSMPALSEVFRDGENVIYEVDQSQLPVPQSRVARPGPTAP
jgi:hypothetical protein